MWTAYLKRTVFLSTKRRDKTKSCLNKEKTLSCHNTILKRDNFLVSKMEKNLNRRKEKC